MAKPHITLIFEAYNFKKLLRRFQLIFFVQNNYTDIMTWFVGKLTGTAFTISKFCHNFIRVKFYGAFSVLYSDNWSPERQELDQRSMYL